MAHNGVLKIAAPTNSKRKIQLHIRADIILKSFVFENRQSKRILRRKVGEVDKAVKRCAFNHGPLCDVRSRSKYIMNNATTIY